MNWKIPLFDLDYDQQEETAVLDVLRSKWLTMGEVTQRFEQAFAEYIGVKHAFAVSNGTVALHLCCLAAGIQPGSEVIVPGLTFVATAACARYVDAVPVFADITGSNDLTISAASIEALITPITSAIIVMHYAGYPCDMPAIAALARKHHLLLIEDAAHAPGASLNGKKAGAWGDAAAFSFFSNKNLATGEGGMVTTDNDEFAERIRRCRSHGMTTLTWDRHKGQALSYDITGLGYNYRPNEIMSALGLVQLAKLDRNNAHRRELTALYRQLIAERLPTLRMPFDQHPGTTAAHILPVLLPEGIDRIELMTTLKGLGIQTSIHYPIIPDFQDYRSAISAGAPDSIPLIRRLAPRELTLPLYAQMPPEHIHTVVDTLAGLLPPP